MEENSVLQSLITHDPTQIAEDSRVLEKSNVSRKFSENLNFYKITKHGLFKNPRKTQPINLRHKHEV